VAKTLNLTMEKVFCSFYFTTIHTCGALELLKFIMYGTKCAARLTKSIKKFFLKLQ